MKNYAAILHDARLTAGYTLEGARDELVREFPSLAPSSKTLFNYHTPASAPAKPDVFLLLALADMYGVEASDLLGDQFDRLQALVARSRCFTESAGHGP